MKNSVELLGYYGSDEVIACSAWTSTSRDLTDDKRDRIPKLIHMLWSNGHETPFEKGVVHFLVNTDIATHIHLLKHRISSLNAESARYKEFTEDKYYIPEDWGDVKCDRWCGHDELGKKWTEVLEEYTLYGNGLYHQCLADLEPVLGRKRAKESARFFKSYNSQIQADVSFNLRSFANFIKLRRSSHAQLEICQIADEMLQLVRDIEGNPFQHTIDAWEKSGVICGFGLLPMCRLGFKIADHDFVTEDWYKCPKCKGDMILVGAQHCQDCGVKLEWELSGDREDD